MLKQCHDINVAYTRETTRLMSLHFFELEIISNGNRTGNKNWTLRMKEIKETLLEQVHHTIKR